MSDIGGRQSLRFEVGDMADLQLWDKTVPTSIKFGITEVMGVRASTSESGWMIEVKSRSGRKTWLDQNWATRIMV